MPDEEIVLNLRVPEGFFDDLDRRFAETADRFGGRLRQGGGTSGGAGGGGAAGGKNSRGDGKGWFGSDSGSWTNIVTSTALGGVGGAATALGTAFMASSAAENQGRAHRFGAGMLDDTSGGRMNIDLSQQRIAQRNAQGELARQEFWSGVLAPFLGNTEFTGEANRLRAQNEATFGVKGRVASQLGAVYGNLARLGVPYSDQDVLATGRFGLAIEKRAYDADQHAQKLINSIDVPSSTVRGAGMGW